MLRARQRLRTSAIRQIGADGGDAQRRTIFAIRRKMEYQSPVHGGAVDVVRRARKRLTFSPGRGSGRSNEFTATWRPELRWAGPIRLPLIGCGTPGCRRRPCGVLRGRSDDLFWAAISVKTCSITIAAGYMANFESDGTQYNSMLNRFMLNYRGRDWLVENGSLRTEHGYSAQVITQDCR